MTCDMWDIQQTRMADANGGAATGFKGKDFLVAVHVVPPFISYDQSKAGPDA